MYCPKCGRENLDGASFCQACGQSLATSDQGATPAQSAPPTHQGQPYQGQPYQGQPYQQTGGAQTPSVPSHLAWSIVSLLVFCLITGIIAVVYASRVDNRLVGGDVRGAQDASNKAKTWCIVSTVIFVIWVIIVGVVRAIAR